MSAKSSSELIEISYCGIEWLKNAAGTDSLTVAALF